MLAYGYTVDRIATESGIAKPELWQWIHDREHPSENRIRVENGVVEWLKAKDEADLARGVLPDADTTTRLSILSVLEQARLTPTCGVVCGVAGCGKTSTALHFQQLHPGRVFYASATSFTRSPTAILYRLAEAIFHADDFRRSVNAREYRQYALAERIRSFLVPQSLIIIDEAQHLGVAEIDAIRNFHDEPPHPGLVLMGNEAVWSRVLGKARKADFSQINSRIGLRLVIERIEEADVDAVLQAWRVRGSAERQFLLDVARCDGGLRQLAHLVRTARLTARELNRPLDAQILREVASSLGIID
jgi:DNA transposition AAA+ family ATPase